MNIGASLPRASIGLATLQQNKAVVGICDHVLTLPLHKNASVLIFPDIQRPIGVPVLEQIKELLVVNLQEGAVDRVTYIALILNLIESLEESLNGPRNYTELQVVLQEWVHFAVVVHLPDALLYYGVLARETLVVIPVRPEHCECLT